MHVSYYSWIRKSHFLNGLTHHSCCWCTPSAFCALKLNKVVNSEQIRSSMSLWPTFGAITVGWFVGRASRWGNGNYNCSCCFCNYWYNKWTWMSPTAYLHCIQKRVMWWIIKRSRVLQTNEYDNLLSSSGKENESNSLCSSAVNLCCSSRHVRSHRGAAVWSILHYAALYLQHIENTHRKIRVWSHIPPFSNCRSCLSLISL